MEQVRVQFCVYCSQLVSQDADTAVMKHWPSLAALGVSSLSCRCCLLLYGVFVKRSSEAQARFEFSDLEIQSLLLTITSFSSRDLVHGIHSKAVTFALNLPNGFSYPFDFTIASCPLYCKSSASPLLPVMHTDIGLPVPAKASKYPSWQRLPTSSGSRLTQVGRWLRRCEKNHPACIPNKQTPLPNRLIDLLPRDNPIGPYKEFAKLVLAEDLALAETHPQYTALSYCWGDSGHFKTKRATVDAFHQNIPTSELPLSFADAFCLTRQLGIRYIWVDALCIVQDDDLDWDTETSKMHDVYTGSCLTIQAS